MYNSVVCGMPFAVFVFCFVLFCLFVCFLFITGTAPTKTFFGRQGEATVEYSIFVLFNFFFRGISVEKILISKSNVIRFLPIL